jgi:hypothetical protein
MFLWELMHLHLNQALSVKVNKFIIIRVIITIIIIIIRTFDFPVMCSKMDFMNYLFILCLVNFS